MKRFKQLNRKVFWMVDMVFAFMTDLCRNNVAMILWHAEVHSHGRIFEFTSLFKMD